MNNAPRPFGWWVQKYEERCGSLTFEEREELFFVPDRGFMVWTISPDMKSLLVTKMCGDGRYWRDAGIALFEKAHADYGVMSIRTVTRRDPKAYIRFFGDGVYHEKTVEVEGRPLYWMRLDWKEA